MALGRQCKFHAPSVAHILIMLSLYKVYIYIYILTVILKNKKLIHTFATCKINFIINEGNTVCPGWNP